MNTLDLLGLIAGTLTTVSFMPQVIKTWKSKSAKDISTAMFIVLSIGIILWIVYGFLTKAIPVIAANFATLILVLIIIILKFKYNNK